STCFAREPPPAHPSARIQMVSPKPIAGSAFLRRRQPCRVTSTCASSPYPIAAISLRITFFADPHLLTPIESNSYKKHRGGTHFPPSSSPAFRLPVTYLESTLAKLIQKQTTSSSFRINTYEKHRNVPS